MVMLFGVADMMLGAEGGAEGGDTFVRNKASREAGP